VARVTGDASRATSTPAEQARIRVAIVDDHPVVRDGVASVLGREPDIEVVERGATVADAVALLARDDLDILILDVRLGAESGLAAVQSRRRAGPAVVVLTAYAYPQYAAAAMQLGAAGFAIKNGPIEDLLAAVRAAAAGGLAFNVRPAEAMALSQREREVVGLVVEGRSNDEIAARLGISTKTVESHLRRIFERLGVASRTELATRALREGWLEVPLAEPPSETR
jgi:DNA-binding NarL/FixJ family response regulator